MARTALGRSLTEQHYRGQLQLRAQVVRDFARLWPLWIGDERSFRTLAEASVPLARVYHQMSASLGAGYFTSFRSAEGLGGPAAPRLPSPLDPEALVGTLFVTGRDTVRDGIAAGFSPQAARQNALTKTSGTISRFALNGGRDSVLASTAADPQAQGYVRVTSGDPCAFCALLCSRGPVYAESSVDFQAHDHCSCGAEPAYAGSEWPGRAREFRDKYNTAVKDARTTGDLARDTSNDSLNAFRRSLNAN